MCRWGELTGQAQGWSLFAPVFGHQASLPAVYLYRTGAQTSWINLHSPFRPADPNAYFRLPESSCRLFNYEYRLALLYWTWSADSFGKHRDEWSQAALDRVRRQQKSMLAYMRWRADRYVRDNPRGLVPTRAELVAELIPSPPPAAPDDLRQPYSMFLLARWFLGTPPPPGCLPVQAYDQVAGQWVWLSEDE
jgi:hypothetical protein